MRTHLPKSMTTEPTTSLTERFRGLLERWWNPLCILGVVLGLLVASGLLGLIFGKEQLLLGLLVTGFAAALLGMLLLMYYFETMVLGILLTCLAIPFDLPTGTMTDIPVSYLLTLAICVLWFVSMYIRHTWRLTPSKLNRPLITFGAICCLSWVWGTLWRDPVVGTSSRFLFVQGATVLCYLLSLAMPLIIGNFVQTPMRLLYLMLTMVIIGTVIMVCLSIGIDQPVLQARGMGLLWTTVCAYSLLVSMPKLRLPVQLGLLSTIGLWFYWQVLVNSTWLSGWIPTVVALGSATWFRSKRLTVILGLIGVIGIITAHDFFVDVFAADLTGGSTERIGIWEQQEVIISAHWLLGTGPAGYKPYLETYFPGDTRSSHNNYVDILSQFGLLGFAAWIWLAVTGISEGWRATRRAPPGILRAAAIAGVGGWTGAQAGMFFGDWVLPFTYNL